MKPTDDMQMKKRKMLLQETPKAIGASLLSLIIAIPISRLIGWPLKATFLLTFVPIIIAVLVLTSSRESKQSNQKSQQLLNSQAKEQGELE